MAAASTDKIRKKKSNFSTTLSSGVNDSVATIPLSSSSGLPTDTAVTLTIDRVDANGNSTPTLMERITGVVGVNQITTSTRGVEGTAQAHASGAIVEDIWEAATWNDLCTAFLSSHSQSGNLKSGAQIDDTSQDHQYVIAVSELTADRTVTLPLLLSADTFAFADHIQTFTNKTLTSPVMQGSISGWINVTGTWTYLSATTITVPTGAASIYRVGDRIKVVNSTTKYFYIVAVADTVLTITGGADYTLTNTAITSPMYSHGDPLDMPSRFSFTPGWTGFSAAPSGALYFTIKGSQCFIIGDYGSMNGTSNATGFTMTGLPVAAAISTSKNPLIVRDAGADSVGAYLVATTVITFNKDAGGGAFTNSGVKGVLNLNIVYYI